MRFRGLTSMTLACGMFVAACGNDGPTADDIRNAQVTVTAASAISTSAPVIVTIPTTDHEFDDWEVYLDLPLRDLTITSRGFQPRQEIDTTTTEPGPYVQRLTETLQFNSRSSSGYERSWEITGRVMPRTDGRLIELDADDGPNAALSLLSDNRAAVLSADGATVATSILEGFAAVSASLIPLPDEPLGIDARWFTHKELFDAGSLPGTFEVVAISADRLTIEVSGDISDSFSEGGGEYLVEGSIGGTLEIELTNNQVTGSVIVVGTGTSVDDGSTAPYLHGFVFEGG